MEIEREAHGLRVRMSDEEYAARAQCNIGLCHGCGREVRGVDRAAKPTARTPDDDGGPKCTNPECATQAVVGVEQARAEGWLLVGEEGGR